VAVYKLDCVRQLEWHYRRFGRTRDVRLVIDICSLERGPVNYFNAIPWRGSTAVRYNDVFSRDGGWADRDRAVGDWEAGRGWRSVKYVLAVSIVNPVGYTRRVLLRMGSGKRVHGRHCYFGAIDLVGFDESVAMRTIPGRADSASAAHSRLQLALF
jgi:hypothetical protein